MGGFAFCRSVSNSFSYAWSGRHSTTNRVDVCQSGFACLTAGLFSTAFISPIDNINMHNVSWNPHLIVAAADAFIRLWLFIIVIIREVSGCAVSTVTTIHWAVAELSHQIHSQLRSDPPAFEIIEVITKRHYKAIYPAWQWTRFRARPATKKCLSLSLSLPHCFSSAYFQAIKKYSTLSNWTVNLSNKWVRRSVGTFMYLSFMLVFFCR